MEKRNRSSTHNERNEESTHRRTNIDFSSFTFFIFILFDACVCVLVLFWSAFIFVFFCVVDFFSHHFNLLFDLSKNGGRVAKTRIKMKNQKNKEEEEKSVCSPRFFFYTHKKENEIQFIFTLFHHVFLFLLMCSIEFITVASASAAVAAFETKLHTDVFYPG